jgi:hypothetical protein
MFGSHVLDAAIGISFVFLVLSLMATSGREIVEGWLQSRAVHLERGIREMLKDPDGTQLASKIYNHPLIASLYTGDYKPAEQLRPVRIGKKDPWQRLKFRSNLPAYIPSRNFAVALLDLAARGEAVVDAFDGPVTLESIRAGIVDNIPNARVQRAILLALDQAKGDLDQARANIEAWYDSGMDRVSGWYRKQTQWILFSMGLATAVLLNVNPIRIAHSLYADDSTRALIVAEAQAAVDADVQGRDTASLAKALGCTDTADAGKLVRGESCAQAKLEGIGLPIGWSGYVWPTQIEKGHRLESFGLFLLSLAGWLLTGLAVALGAPFWFDALNKMMVIRSTVKPHEKSPEEASEDRQQPAPRAAPATPATLADAGPAPALGGPVVRRELDDPGFQPNEWRDKQDPQEGDL